MTLHLAIPRVFVLLLLLVARAALGAPISVHDFAPTQMEVGRAAIKARVAKWRADAKSRGLSLKAYAEQVLRPTFAGYQLATIIDPSGVYRNTDAHHRISAARVISLETGVAIEVNPDIIADYRGRSHDAYAQHLVETLGKGQFTPEVEALPVSERVRRLPATYAQLGNNPMRSAFELVFLDHGITGEWMKDYVEFRAGRRLIADGLLDQLKADGVLPRGARSLPTRLATDPRVHAAIVARLRQPAIKSWLLAEAKTPESRQQLSAKLDALP